MIHTEITFDGVSGPVSVRMEPSGEESTAILVKVGKRWTKLDAAELEHIYRLLQAYRAAQEAALKALE